jgi:hypothetical protein
MIVPNDLIPVDPSRLYNFYFKLHKSATLEANVYWRLAWLDAGGNRMWSHGLEGGNTPTSGNWEQVSSGMFREYWQVRPTLRVTPPAGAAYAQVRFGLNGPFYGPEINHEVFVDDVVLDSMPGLTISDAKLLPDDTPVSLKNKSVTMATGMGGVPADVFYIEEADRSSGIRVASATVVNVGDNVAVDGIMATTAAGERYIDATAGSVTAGMGTAVQAVGVNTRTVQIDTKTVGLLVRVSGTVREVGADYYTIADGYMEAGGEVTTKVVAPSPTVSVDDFVIVTGVVSKDTTTANSILLRPAPVLPTPTNTWSVSFETGEGYALGPVSGQPSGDPNAWTNSGDAAVVASPDPVFGARALRFANAGEVDMHTPFAATALQFVILKAHVFVETGANNQLEWWGPGSVGYAYDNITTPTYTQPIWNVGGMLPTVTGQWGEIVSYYDFSTRLVSTWYNGKPCDVMRPFGGTFNIFPELDFYCYGGTGAIYFDSYEVGYTPL